MSNSPYVILDFRGYSALDTSETNSFYRCKSGKNYLDYVSRESALGLKDSQQELAELCSENQLFVQRGSRDVLGYINDRTGSTGVFNENGMLSKQNFEKIRSNLRSTQSIIWTGVVSFTPEVASQLCKNKRQAQEILKENLPLLLKGTQIDYDNINWYGAYHTNTDNPHIHFIMYEKAPVHFNSKGEKVYTKKITIGDEHFSEFKYNITKNFNKENFSYYHLRDETRRGLALSLGNDKFFLNTFYNNSADIIRGGNFQYAKLTKEQQQKVDGFVKTILRTNPNLQKNYNDYKTSLLTEQANIFKIHEHNRSTPTFESKNFFNSRMNELNRRLANQFLKILKQTHNEKLPYLNYKQTLRAPSIKHSMLMRKKTMLDITTQTATKFLADLAHNMEQETNTLTMDYYKYLKQKEGDKVYE